MSDDGWLQSIQSVHVLGAGLREDRPAHQAFHDAGHLGYRMVPVHPRDAGNTLLGRPIRSQPWQNGEPELFVLFLSPDRVMAALRQWLLEGRTMPFIWLQPGAEQTMCLNSFRMLTLLTVMVAAGLSQSLRAICLVPIDSTKFHGSCKRWRKMAVNALCGEHLNRERIIRLMSPWSGLATCMIYVIRMKPLHVTFDRCNKKARA